MTEESSGPSTSLGALSRQALEYLAQVALRRGIPTPADPLLRDELLRHSLVGAAEKDLVTELEDAVRDGDDDKIERILETWQAAPSKPSQVWALLESLQAPALQHRIFRTALTVNSSRSLRWLIDQPHPQDADLRLLQIEAMIRRGECKRAVDLLGTPDGEGAMLLGEALCGAGDPHRAIEVLEAVQPASEHQRIRRDLAMVTALFHGDRSVEAQQLLRRAEAAIAKLPAEKTVGLEARASDMRVRLGLRQAEPGQDASERLFPIEGAIAQSLRFVAAGSLRRSTRLLDTLQRVDLPAEGSITVRVMQGVLRVIRGRYRGLPQLARSLTQEAEQMGNATLYYWAYLLERLTTLGDAHNHPEPPWADEIPPPTGIPARYLAALRTSHRARAGLPVADHELPRAEPGDGPFVECICSLTEANVRLLQGDAEAAVTLAREVIGRTVGLGYRFFEGEALLIHCYALLSVGDLEHLREAIGTLDRISRRWRSERYATLASLLRCALHRHPDIATLLRVAHEDARSPTAARVARNLLGGPELNDALDQTIARGVSNNWVEGVQSLRRDAPGWVFDPTSRVAHQPQKTQPLSPMDVRILDALFLAGGSLSLEEFATRVWELDEFHPLRDSKRIHVAVRRLRKRIEDTPSQPVRLVTFPEGYAFGEAVGRVAGP
ncbi:MAG: helix-turn-helix domain-containing protein [Myxococcota bacterium]